MFRLLRTRNASPLSFRHDARPVATHALVRVDRDRARDLAGLLTDGWAALSAKLAEPIVLAVPANDAMFVAIGPSPAEIAKLGEVVAKIFGSAERPVSRRLFRWKEGRREAVP